MLKNDFVTSRILILCLENPDMGLIFERKGWFVVIAVPLIERLHFITESELSFLP